MSSRETTLFNRDQAVDDMLLLRQYVEGQSEQAFAQIVERHSKWIRAVCHRALNSAELADDATQVVFITLARKAALLPLGTRVSGWLYRTAKFVVSDIRKHETRHRRRQDQAIQNQLERTGRDLIFQESSARESVNDVLAMLPPRERSAVEMHYLDGLTFRQMGRALGLSRDGAKKRVARALVRLRSGLRAKRMLGIFLAGSATLAKLTAPARAALTAAGQLFGTEAGALFAKFTIGRAVAAGVIVSTAALCGNRLSELGNSSRNLNDTYASAQDSSPALARPARNITPVIPALLQRTVALPNSGGIFPRPEEFSLNSTAVRNPVVNVPASQLMRKSEPMRTAAAKPATVNDRFVLAPATVKTAAARFDVAVATRAPSIDRDEVAAIRERADEPIILVAPNAPVQTSEAHSITAAAVLNSAVGNSAGVKLPATGAQVVTAITPPQAASEQNNQSSGSVGSGTPSQAVSPSTGDRTVIVQSEQPKSNEPARSDAPPASDNAPTKIVVRDSSTSSFVAVHTNDGSSINLNNLNWPTPTRAEGGAKPATNGVTNVASLDPTTHHFDGVGSTANEASKSQTAGHAGDAVTIAPVAPVGHSAPPVTLVPLGTSPSIFDTNSPSAVLSPGISVDPPPSIVMSPAILPSGGIAEPIVRGIDPSPVEVIGPMPTNMQVVPEPATAAVCTMLAAGALLRRRITRPAPR